ncbi:MAG: acyl-CoA--6-aminopenicillanic acid acyltransferase [Candidatus Rokubacteria bacterium]|nr:acyl-CoA--6-aminopenicillanic acid acyltransferase [Candidatus Rokubacteria bacterium]
MIEAFPLIEMSGPPRERGRQYGRQASARIALGVEHYATQLAKMSCDWPTIRGLVQDCLPRIEAFEPAYVEEMRGIAEGAGLDFEAIVLLNARTEILKLGSGAGGRLSARAPAPSDDACTGVVALPEATPSRRLIHAQNWDWKVECAETAVVLSIRRDDGPDLLTFTEAGGLARSGLNAAGIAIDFECAPDETFQVHPERGLLVHANHWVSPVALATLKDTGIANTPCTLYRDLRVRSLLAPQIGSITREAVKTALFDDFAAPWSVCRPPRAAVNGTMTATVAMIVREPALGVMEVAPLPALDRHFTTYHLPAGRPATVAAG